MVTVVWGWLSLLPVPDSCRGFCGRAGQRGAQRPRSGAASALDAAAREPIIAGGRAGMPGGWGEWSGVAAFLCGVTVSGDGRGTRPGAASLTLARGACCAPVTG